MATIEKRQQISYTNQFLKLLCKSGKRVKPHTWKDKDGTPNLVNQRIFALYLGEKMEYTKMEDWYEINVKDMRNHKGGGLLTAYNSSPFKFVMAVFSEKNWLEWKFKNNKFYWKYPNNHKKYAIWLGKKLGYTEIEDWYQLKLDDIVKNDGGGLVKHYDESPIKFVMSIFPKKNWLVWKFIQVYRGFWKDGKKKYAIWLGKKLGYTKPEDWYQVTIQHFRENYGGTLVKHYGGSLSKLVPAMFPKHDWDISKFKKRYSHGQIQWLEFLKISTPDIRHILNHPDGEFYIPGSREFVGGCGYHADGFSEIELMIYEYLGDFYHGNPALYKPDDWCKWLKTTYGALYNKELKRQRFCEDSGFGYHSIWESEWHRGIRAIVQVQRKFKNRITVQ